MLSSQQTSDAEVTLRLRKKIERESNFTTAVQRAVADVSSALLLNNAENLTTAYFKPAASSQKQAESCRVLACFKDSELVKRGVAQVSFCPEASRAPRRFAVCYRGQLDEASRGLLETRCGNQRVQTSNDAFIFDLSNPNEPEAVLASQFPISCLKFSQKDAHIVLCGLTTGVVALYDTRRGTYPVAVSEIRHSHKSEVAELRILKSKSGCEFVTVGADGFVLYWNYADLSRPVEA